MGLFWRSLALVLLSASLVVARMSTTPKTAEAKATDAAPKASDEVAMEAEENHQRMKKAEEEDQMESTTSGDVVAEAERKHQRMQGEEQEAEPSDQVRLQHAASADAGAAEDGQRPEQMQMRRWTQRMGVAGSAGIITLLATHSGPSESTSTTKNMTKQKTSIENSNATCSPCTTVPSRDTTCPPPPLWPSSLTAASLAEMCPSPCSSPCPMVPTCPTCPTVSPNPSFLKCPSPCPSPPPCPACPTLPPIPPPMTCPSLSPCASPPPCPSCPPCTRPLPPGYERLYSAYRLHLTPLDWFAAKATCEREGAHLAIINSEGEADVISNYLRRSRDVTVSYVMMGYHDTHSEGNFHTVLDQPLESAGYNRWTSGEPNNAGNEDCVGVFAIGMSMNDHSCSVKLPFLCEIP